MTFAEKLEREHPEFFGPEYPGGFALCPVDAGYEKTSPCVYAHGEYTAGIPDCYACWHRVIPGTEDT